MKPCWPSLFAGAILVMALPRCGGAPKAERAPAAEASIAVAPPPEGASLSEGASAPEAAEPDRLATTPGQAAPPPLMPLNVPECDNFVKIFVACVDKHVPADHREALMDELNLHRARWRELEKMQEGKVAASLSCRGVAQRLKNDLIVDYGCEF
ncbi:MAG: hypothetical protein ABI565_10060 [Vicinamibacteria bacterium]